MLKNPLHCGNICGLKPVVARDLLRRLTLSNRFVTEDTFAEAWEAQLGNKPLPGDLERFVTAGYFAEADGMTAFSKVVHYELAGPGIELRAAKALGRISPQRVALLQKEVAAMAAHQNNTGHWLFSITKIFVQGECLDESLPDYVGLDLGVELVCRVANAHQFAELTFLGHKDGHWSHPEGCASCAAPKNKQLSELRRGRRHVEFNSPWGDGRLIFEATPEELAEAQRRHEFYYQERDRKALSMVEATFGELPPGFGKEKTELSVIASLAEAAELLAACGVPVAQSTPGLLCSRVRHALEQLVACYLPAGDGVFGEVRQLTARRLNGLLARLAELPSGGALQLDRFELEIYSEALDRFLDRTNEAEANFASRPYDTCPGKRELVKLRSGLYAAVCRLEHAQVLLPEHAERARRAFLS